MDEAQEQLQSSTAVDQGEANKDQNDEGGLPVLNIAFFASGCTLMFGSFLGMFTMFISFSFADFLGLVFVFTFGMIVAILDAPVQKEANPSLVDAEREIAKYITFVTGTTGKGVCLFLSACTLESFMISNFDSALIKSFELCMVCGVVGVGAFGVAIGSKKTNELNKVRESILNKCPGGIRQVEAAMCPYAMTFPPKNGSGAGHCLTMDEFNKFIVEVAGGDEFSPEDLSLIFKCLRQRRPGMHTTVPKLTMNDVETWLDGRRYLL